MTTYGTAGNKGRLLLILPFFLLAVLFYVPVGRLFLEAFNGGDGPGTLARLATLPGQSWFRRILLFSVFQGADPTIQRFLYLLQK